MIPETAVRTSILKGTFDDGEARPSAALEQSPAADASASSGAKTSWPVRLLLIAIYIPWMVPVGPVALLSYRIIVLFVLIPCLMRWLTGRAGPKRLADFAIWFYWIWCSVSFLVVQGASTSIQPIGSLLIDTFGPYFIARCFIRNADEFRGMIALQFKIICVVLPFALYEVLTGDDILLDLFGKVMPTIPYLPNESRWGLARAQAIFEHPILYGVTTGSIVGLVFMVMGYGRPMPWRVFITAVVAFASALSLSAGPITAVLLQMFIFAWDRVAQALKSRWLILLSTGAVAYIFISIFSNQTPAEFYLTHFSFDTQNAYYRLLIWKYGTASVANYPFFGVGFGYWERLNWMGTSIDNFWLIHAIQHGIPAAAFMLMAFFSAYIPIALKQGLSHRLATYRLSYIAVLTGFFFVGSTVHFWDATYAQFMFLLGSGFWLLNVPAQNGNEDDGKAQTDEPAA